MIANVIASKNSLRQHIRKKRWQRALMWLVMVAGVLTVIPTRGISLVAVVICAVLVRKSTAAIASLHAGLAGEEQTARELAALPNDFTVLNDLLVQVDGMESQVDHVVVGPTGIFVIETKNLNGIIEGNPTDSRLLQKKTGRAGGHYSKTFYNPIKQVGTHVYRVKTVLQGVGISDWIQGVVYFSNPEAEVRVHNQMHAGGTTSGHTIPVFSAAGEAPGGSHGAGAGSGGNRGATDLRAYVLRYDGRLDKRLRARAVETLRAFVR